MTDERFPKNVAAMKEQLDIAQAKIAGRDAQIEKLMAVMTRLRRNLHGHHWFNYCQLGHDSCGVVLNETETLLLAHALTKLRGEQND
jgi:hypothetical protein